MHMARCGLLFNATALPLGAAAAPNFFPCMCILIGIKGGGGSLRAYSPGPREFRGFRLIVSLCCSHYLAKKVYGKTTLMFLVKMVSFLVHSIGFARFS